MSFTYSGCRLFFDLHHIRNPTVFEHMGCLPILMNIENPCMLVHLGAGVWTILEVQTRLGFVNLPKDEFLTRVMFDWCETPRRKALLALIGVGLCVFSSTMHDCGWSTAFLPRIIAIKSLQAPV